jgi:hypothetical protein
MMTAATVGGRNYRYLYASNDERIAAVERVVVGSTPRTKTTWTLRGLGPQLQRVYFDDNTSGTRVFTFKEDVFWRGSQLLGSDTPTGLRHYGLDHLGSPASSPTPPAPPSAPRTSPPSVSAARATAAPTSSRGKNATRRHWVGARWIWRITSMRGITGRMGGGSCRSIR